MGHAGYFALVAVACASAMAALTRARWTWLTPRLAIVCWQAAGLGLGLALIGLPLAYGLAPYGGATVVAAGRFGVDLMTGGLVTGGPPAGMGPARIVAAGVGLLIAGRLLWVTTACLLRALRAQRRHRDLLTLVGRSDPAAPGALVLDHPRAAAYCLPGIRPTVVVSAGTLNLLEHAELTAVLGHERAHAEERHDLVLLPFTALCRVLPRARLLRRAYEAVALLVEMRADDRARRHAPAASLAAALRRFAAAPSAGTPAGALGLVDRAIEARLQRLATDQPPTPARGGLALAASALLAVVPAGLLVVPW